MADVSTSLYVKKVDFEEFKKWFENESGGLSIFDDWVQDCALCLEFEGGYGGYFWEYLALKMVCEFDGIVFRGRNQVMYDDHLVRTFFECDGEIVEFTRTLELPDFCYDEDLEEECFDGQDDMCAEFEVEYGIPYNEKFTTDEVEIYTQIYKELGEKIKDSDIVESTCSKYQVYAKDFKLFNTIYNFKNRH